MPDERSPARHRGIRLGIVKAFTVGMMASAIVAVLLILTQDVQIFPGVIDRLNASPLDPPHDVIPFEITTSDGERLPVWRVDGGGPRGHRIALLFHGNAESLASFIGTQRWFAGLGFTNYAVTYRGFRGSTGFPSEAGIELDAEAALNLVLSREHVTPKDLLVFGSSIGTGPATYLAVKFDLGTLVLIAPYTSIPDVVRERGLLALLAPFLWYSMPSLERIPELETTCVILAHGRQDTIIDYTHSIRLRDAYRGAPGITLLSRDHANHFDIFGAVQTELATAIERCIHTPE